MIHTILERGLIAALILIVAVINSSANETRPNLVDSQDGFVDMFNGKDLSGWKRINTADSTWKVKDDMVICSGKPIGELRTERMYQNFIMELEWRHMVPKGNAGVFVWADDITAKGVPFHRGIEVQVLENAYGKAKWFTTHGDIFPIHGARMTPVNGRGGQRAFPTEERSKPSPEWNHYRITCIDGNISLAVNGKVVTKGTNCNPRKGYICLESEGGIVHYRNVRIKELPGEDVPKEETAIADRGYRCLYNGIDLNNWKTDGDFWKPSDWVLKCTSKDKSTSLETKETFSETGFLFDFRTPNDSTELVLSLGDVALTFSKSSDEYKSFLSKGNGWNRIEGTFQRGNVTLKINGNELKQTESGPSLNNVPLKFEATGSLDLTNIYVRKLGEKK